MAESGVGEPGEPGGEATVEAKDLDALQRQVEDEVRGFMNAVVAAVRQDAGYRSYSDSQLAEVISEGFEMAAVSFDPPGLRARLSGRGAAEEDPQERP